MEDDARAVPVEDLAQLLAVADVGDHRHARREVALVRQLALDLVERRLGLVDEDQPRRARPCRLTAELGADRAAGARDQHRLAAQVRRNRLEIDLDGLAPEDVLDLDGPDLRREVRVAGDELVEPGQSLHRHLRVAGLLDDFLAHLAGGGGDRDQKLVRPVVAEDVGQLGGRPEHAHALNPVVALANVVVDEPDRRVADPAALHLLDDQLARVARADDDHLFPARDQPGRCRTLEDRPREQARSGDEREQEQPVDERDPAGKTRGVREREEIDDEARRERGDGHPAERAPHVPRGHVAPPPVVEAESREDDELDRDDEQHRPPADELLVERRDLPERVEANLEREQPGGGNQPAVGGELPDPVSVHQAVHRTASSDTASLTAATIRSCTSAPIPAHIGSARFSREARSVSGKSVSACPRKASAGCRCSGVT